MTSNAETQPTLYEQLRQLPFGWRKEISAKIGVHYNSVYNTLVRGMNGKNSPAIIAEATALVQEWKMKQEETTAQRLDKLKRERDAAQKAFEAALEEQERLLTTSATA